MTFALLTQCSTTEPQEHKTERQSWIIQETTHCIKGMSTFEQGNFNKFSYYFVLWRIYKHLLGEIAYSEQY